MVAVRRASAAAARQPAVALLLLLAAGCAARPPASTPFAPLPEPATEPPPSLEPAAVAGLARTLFAHAERHTTSALSPRTLTHGTLWQSLEPVIGTGALHRAQIGRSVENRPLYAVEFGRGPVRVLLWSQMHGDEPTATLAMVDMLSFLVENRADPLVQELEARLTIAFVPMLNPDGAQRRRRENMMGIDINRDARRQVSPEARALSALHARFSPHFGFNLHDQALRLTDDGRSVALALLAPPHDAGDSDNLVRIRAKKVAAVMRLAADALVDGRITRYDPTYNDRAFGDAMQSWGTSTILVETGSWEKDVDKTFLRRVNFALLLTALDAIATGSFELAHPAVYESLPANGQPGNHRSGSPGVGGARPLAGR
jgi:hypothetical protein